MKKLIVGVLFLSVSQLAFAARLLIMFHPIEGNGPQWNCSLINGTVYECPNGSPLSSFCYKKSGSNWNVLCAGFPTSTPPPPAINWSTVPDPSIPGTYKGPANNWIYKATGNYRAIATAYCTDLNGSPSDENFFVIP